jgi:predicted LPLAT superfamily acyltransferase
MSDWTGKSKGSLLGYKFFAWLIKKTGLRFAYFILIFVAFYYAFTSWKSNKAIYYYFRKRLKFGFLKSVSSVFRSYYIFGQTLLDRVVISTGMLKKFSYEFDGIENILAALDEGKGGVLISAHIGNFEISEYFFEEGHNDIVTTVLTTDLEKQQIKNYLEGMAIQSKSKYVALSDDLSHVFELHKALANNEFICLTGDRYVEGGKFFEADFLGKTARFPAGPFIIASKLKVPVFFVYVMKDSSFHYHLYGRKAEVEYRNPQILFESYINNLTGMVQRYPRQWFNYFKFWG